LNSFILKDDFYNSEVIVIDNASTDGSVDILRARFPHVNLIQNQTNLGFAAANNQGIRQSTRKYMLLLNPDTEVKPGAIDALFDFMEAHPKAGACGARLLNPDGSLQYSCSPAPTLGREFLRLLHLPGMRSDGYYEMADWDLETPRRVDTLMGACLMVRRATLDQVGLLDEDYFMYSEEVDLCKRIRDGGWEIYWVPQAQVIHYGGQSTQQVAEQMFIELYKSKLLYFRKHHGRFKAGLYKLLLGLVSLTRVGFGSFEREKVESKGERSRTTANNYRRLLAELPGL
jgi:hypothetical protein